MEVETESAVQAGLKQRSRKRGASGHASVGVRGLNHQRHVAFDGRRSMRLTSVLIALAMFVALAGCTNNTEESVEVDDTTRRVVVKLPRDVHQIEVQVDAQTDGFARLQVEVEQENGDDIVEETFDIFGNVTRIVIADTGSHRTVAILVSVAEGDATLDVTIRGVRDAGGVVVVHEERIVVVQPAGGADTNATATPSPEAETNTTSTDNSTNTTANETNATP